MKNIKAILLSSLLLFSTTQAEEADKPIKIGITHCCSKEDVYMWNVYQGILSAAKNQKNVTTIAKVANEDANLQDQQISQLIAENVDAIVMRLVVDSSEGHQFYTKQLDKIKKANIPAVLYVVNVDKENFQEHKNLYFVGSISSKSGILEGEKVIKNWQKNPDWDLNKDGVIQYAILKGSEGNPDAEGRTKWAPGIIKSYVASGIKSEQVALEVANWRLDEAEGITTNWLNSDLKDQIEVYIANNDAMALGALNALKKQGLSRPIFGVDALPNALEAIKNGEMTATVLQDSKGQAEEALNLAVNLARKNPLHTNTSLKVVDRKLMIPYTAIDSDNIEDFIK